MSRCWNILALRGKQEAHIVQEQVTVICYTTSQQAKDATRFTECVQKVLCHLTSLSSLWHLSVAFLLLLFLL